MALCSLSGMVQNMASSLRVQRTVSVKETPLLFREPGVLTCFRPQNKPWTYYLFSVCQIHNESLNIWSHLVGFCVILCTLCQYLNMDDVPMDGSHWPVILAFGLCSLIYTFLSVFAHIFHSKSDIMHYTCFQLDYMGIGYFSLGFAMVNFYCSCYHGYYAILAPYFLPVNVILSWTGFVCSSVAKLRYRRPYPFRRKLWNVCSFGSHALAVFCLVLKRYWECWKDEACSLSSMSHHTNVFMAAAISVMFFSSHLPEKLFPGQFDIVGQGHQIFHVLCTLGTLWTFNAAHVDIRLYALDKSTQHPDMFSILTAMVIYGALSVGTVVVLHPFTKRRIQRDRDLEDKQQ